jgi:hypothetical protein
MTLDKDTAEQLRKEMESKKGSSKSGGKARGPVDSGKGVRIQVRHLAQGSRRSVAHSSGGGCAVPTHVFLLLLLAAGRARVRLGTRRHMPLVSLARSFVLAVLSPPASAPAASTNKPTPFDTAQSCSCAAISGPQPSPSRPLSAVSLRHACRTCTDAARFLHADIALLLPVPVPVLVPAGAARRRWRTT